jgi:hypothetical protein
MPSTSIAGRAMRKTCGLVSCIGALDPRVSRGRR